MKNSFSENLLGELNTRLDSLSDGDQISVALLKARTSVITEALKTLSDFYVPKIAEDPLIEIDYYKGAYPMFKSLIIYHTELHYFMTGIPESGLKVKKKYYLSKLRSIAAFFEQNSMHYDYFRLDGGLLDRVFYSKGDMKNILQPFVLSYEPILAPPMGELVSWFMAYERLRNGILAMLHELSGPAGISATVVDAGGNLHREFKWTGGDIHLIELVHGIFLTGQVNNGEIGIVELFQVVGKFFGVNLRVPKRGFDDLKARKTMSRTAFLDMMRAALLKKMDDDDAYDHERARRRNGF
ncbi:hypothetical protein OC25_03770 [Pedobacter kyungheensis]|uniref:RteC protein n=1 Tax=Pedobacter kyungheensis TaxID=1069985 RepID=A0A0C1FWI5_9SPHI|nr:RteC domain-containing protein [Pedobacter kyungheensis]KIA96208.1 hypothetical protein OC25_03770 [Pedobacter kyungheensis]